MGGKRTTFQDPETGQWMRRCSVCTEVKDLEDDFYRNTRNEPWEAKDWCYRCKVCNAEYVNGVEKRRREDPNSGPMVRAKDARRKRLERKRSPELHRGAVNRYRRRLRKNAQGWARHLEAQRIAYHLRIERAGRTSTRKLSTATMSNDALPKLPAAPLAVFVDSLIERARKQHDLVGVVSRGRHGLNGASAKSVCASLGIDERMLRAWRTGERVSVQFDVADRVLVASGATLNEVWPEDQFPEVHERLRA
jgi:hypothetical protein